MNPYNKRIYLLLKALNDIEYDDYGNAICCGEASNENLDFDGEKVLQSALLDSREYFLNNGLVSYDHLHLTADNPEEYIIGEPLEVKFNENGEGGKKNVFVKFKLFGTNKIAKEIISKLSAGAKTIKISIGGKLAEKVEDYHNKTKSVIKVLWDEIALTYKPVNQTLQPVTLSSQSFVKSLTSEAAQSPLVKEDLDGANADEESYSIIMEALKYAENKNVDLDKYIEELKKRGVLKETLEKIQKETEKMRKKKDLLKALDEGLEELLKSQEEEEEDFEENEEDADLLENEDVEIEADEEEETEDEGEAAEKEEEQEDEIESLKKETESVKKSLQRLEATVKKQVNLLGKMFEVQKSLGKTPSERKSSLSKAQRFYSGGKKYSKNEILSKAQEAVIGNRMSMADFATIEERLNKGIDISNDVLKSIM